MVAEMTDIFLVTLFRWHAIQSILVPAAGDVGIKSHHEVMAAK